MKVCPICRMTVNAAEQCPICGTALIDAETAHTDREQHLFNRYYVRYLPKTLSSYFAAGLAALPASLPLWA